MQAQVELAEAPQIYDVDYLQQEFMLDWTAEDAQELGRCLAPYIDWIEEFLASGEQFPSHIPGSGSIAVPIGDTTTPDELFAALGDTVKFSVREYPEFWVTVHYPNPEPVVTLIPKVLPGTPQKLNELCARCSRALQRRVGGVGGMFLAWLLPGFSWAMHTDHDNDYEQISTRVHVPIITNPNSIYVWGRKHQGRDDEWLVITHLEAGKIYHVRVDVPHTVVNAHETEPRLHLILDVQDQPLTGEYASGVR